MWCANIGVVHWYSRHASRHCVHVVSMCERYAFIQPHEPHCIGIVNKPVQMIHILACHKSIQCEFRICGYLCATNSLDGLENKQRHRHKLDAIIARCKMLYDTSYTLACTNHSKIVGIACSNCNNFRQKCNNLHFYTCGMSLRVQFRQKISFQSNQNYPITFVSFRFLQSRSGLHPPKNVN